MQGHEQPEREIFGVDRGSTVKCGASFSSKAKGCKDRCFRSIVSSVYNIMGPGHAWHHAPLWIMIR